MEKQKMSEEERRPTIKFDDEGALDTYIAMSDLTEEQVETLRESVEKFGYGTPIPVPDPSDDEI